MKQRFLDFDKPQRKPEAAPIVNRKQSDQNDHLFPGPSKRPKYKPPVDPYWWAAFQPPSEAEFDRMVAADGVTGL